MENRQEIEERDESTQGAESASGRPRRFGRGIYDKTDTPIRLLDGFIAGIIIIIVVMVAVFALFGGFTVSFETSGGTEIASQKLRYGNYVAEPEEPVRQGYTFAGWYYEGHEKETWDFSVGTVGGDLELIARWEPAQPLNLIRTADRCRMDWNPCRLLTRKPMGSCQFRKKRAVSSRAGRTAEKKSQRKAW